MASVIETKDQPSIVNGVNVTALGETIEAIKGEPTIAAFQFRAANRWLDGGHNRSTIKGFYGAGQEDETRSEAFVFDADEPPVLLGKDSGANPVEYLLHALAGCVTTTMVYHAAAQGIEIRALSSELEGDIDVRGFMGLSDDVPKGYQAIRVRFRVETDAAPETLKELAQMSPVFNSVNGSVPVTIEIETV